jgi:hypothetical protein
MTSTIMPAHGFRLFYIDDSGSPNDGYIVYSWIEVTPGCWALGLRHWLDLRKQLYAAYQIPPAAEIHTTKLIGGRKMPSTAGSFNASKGQRRALVREALESIGQNANVRLGSVYRVTASRGSSYNAERADLYDQLVKHLDGRLTAADEYATIFMDGDGSDPTYFRAHRALKLSTRRIVEDPLFQHSHVSQWVQMADLVAWTTYQAVQQHPGKRFAWSWYDDYLRGSDVNGQPMEL